MIRLTPSHIAATDSDEVLFQLLSAELTRLLGPGPGEDLDLFVLKLQSLPPGLRAMAATHEFDVIMTLDDLGFHFANWRHEALALETLRGLRELGALETAAVFESAIDIARSYWAYLDSPDFASSYSTSALAAALDPLNARIWALHGYSGAGPPTVLDLWVPYARRFPEKVCAA